jgi:hypothetical protein
VRRIVFLALCLALATASASWSPAAEDEKVPLQATKGDELSPEEEKEVRATLTRYLEAIKANDWREAAKYVDRETFLQAVEPMVEAVAPDPAKRAEARHMIFGVSTYDSLARKKLPDLFNSMMNYVTIADPASVVTMSTAKFNLLAARKIRGRVHIAYQLTVPSAADSTQPYTRVSAERLKKIDGDWKVLIAQDHGGGRAKP